MTSLFHLGFTDELFKIAQSMPSPDDVPVGALTGAGAIYEGVPKALLGALIGSMVGPKGKRLKAGLGGAGLGALIGAAKGGGLYGGAALAQRENLKKFKKRDMQVKTASKTVALEELVSKALRSRAGLGAATGATLGGITSDEGLIGGLTRGALVGGAAGWGLPKLLRARASKILKSRKGRRELVRKLRRSGQKVK